MFFLCFLTQFIVTKSNKLYTWGASPQLIRLNNQARKRTKLAQKFEETKIELMTENAGSDLNENFHKKSDATADNVASEEQKNRMNATEVTSIVSASTSHASLEDGNQNIMNVAEESISKPTPVDSSPTASNGVSNVASTSTADQSGKRESGTKSKAKDTKRYDEACNEEESTDHLYPMAVDTSDVVGNIVQVGGKYVACGAIHVMATYCESFYCRYQVVSTTMHWSQTQRACTPGARIWRNSWVARARDVI